MLHMRMTYVVPHPSPAPHAHPIQTTCSMLVMSAPPCRSSDVWECVSIGMHALWQAHPRQRQAAKQRGRPSGNRHGLLFVMMWARPRRNRQLLQGLMAVFGYYGRGEGDVWLAGWTYTLTGLLCAPRVWAHLAGQWEWSGKMTWHGGGG
jgi:hypothetical protein